MNRVMGIDEVGRGSWAGPLLAVAVILDKPIKGLKDSKLLSKPRREKLTVVIKNKALAIGFGWVSSLEIDSLGLTKAVSLAMKRSIDQIKIEYDEIIIDGNYNFLANNSKTKTLVNADNLIPCVSAASIVAKVARDQHMSDMAAKYPGYGFEKHVGYGTSLHREMLKLHGITGLHRKSYQPIKAYLT